MKQSIKTNLTRGGKLILTDSELAAFIDGQRRLYAAGKLPRWQVERLEGIPGWSWTANSTDDEANAEQGRQ
jgi:hypothetical protein